MVDGSFRNRCVVQGGVPVGEGTGGLKVLVVDDDPHIGELLELYLAKGGLQVVQIRDGISTVRALQGAICCETGPVINLNSYHNLSVFLARFKLCRLF